MDTFNMDGVIARSRTFLKDQLLGGNYGMSCLGSDDTVRFSHDKGHVFTSFFLAQALAGSLTEMERTILLTRILSEENDGLWGFSPPHQYVGPEHAPFIVDADDSAYVHRTLRTLGINRSLDRLLSFYRPRSKGFVTFAGHEEPILRFEPAFEHNLDMHPEVNANVMRLLLETHYEEYIRYSLVSECQASEGYWYSYFYPSRFFATYLFLDIASRRDHLEEPKARGIRFLVDSQNKDGSWGEGSDPYETALALNGLLVRGQSEACVARGTRFLLHTMREDGSWETDRRIWEYHDRNQDVWIARDHHRVVVTSLAVMALRRAGGTWYDGCG